MSVRVLQTSNHHFLVYMAMFPFIQAFGIHRNFGNESSQKSLPATLGIRKLAVRNLNW